MLFYGSWKSSTCILSHWCKFCKLDSKGTTYLEEATLVVFLLVWIKLRSRPHRECEKNMQEMSSNNLLNLMTIKSLGYKLLYSQIPALHFVVKGVSWSPFCFEVDRSFMRCKYTINCLMCASICTVGKIVHYELFMP